MNKLQGRRVVLLAGFVLLTTGLSAEPPGSAPFTEAALTGLYTVASQGDGSVSAGVGTVRYDGEGGTTRRIIVSAPGESGGRRSLLFESEGSYTMNADGTGTATYVNTISNGETRSVTFDFAIRGVGTRWAPRRGRVLVATEIFSVQREAGVTVSLVTNDQTRIAEQ